MTTKKLICPCVHGNGTSKESLLRDYEAAWDAIQAALKAMMPTAPNGRDYYPYNQNGQAFDDPFKMADQQFRERLQRLQRTCDEIDLLMNNTYSDIREQYVEIETGD